MVRALCVRPVLWRSSNAGLLASSNLTCMKPKFAPDEQKRIFNMPLLMLSREEGRLCGGGQCGRHCSRVLQVAR